MAWKIVRTLGPGEHHLGPVTIHFDQDGIGWTDNDEAAEKAQSFPKMFKVSMVEPVVVTPQNVPLLQTTPLVVPEDHMVTENGDRESTTGMKTSEPSALQATLDLTSLPPPGTWTEEVLGNETVPTLRKIAELLNVELSPNSRKSDIIELLMIAQEEVILPDVSGATPPATDKEE